MEHPIFLIKAKISIFLTSFHYFPNLKNGRSVTNLRYKLRDNRGYPDRDYQARDDYYGRDRELDRDRHRQRQANRYRNDRRPPPKKDTGGGSSLGVILRVLFLIFILMFFFLPQFEGPRNAFLDYMMAGMYKYQEVPDTIEFKVERLMTLETDGTIDYTLHIPIPKQLKIDGEDAQVLESVIHEPMYSGTENSSWVWDRKLQGGGTSQISIIYEFTTAKIEWDISIGKSGIIDDIKRVSPNLVTRFTGDAWPVEDYNDDENLDFDNDGIPDDRDVDDDNNGIPDKYRIEPSNPEIRDLLIDILVSEDLVSSGTSISNLGHLNAYKVVKALYDHIDDTCVYPTQQQMYDDSQRYGGYPKWGTGTYDDKRGDCDDQSILFISLCRAAGIPSMLEIGALYDVNMDRWEGHGWANVYIPYSSDYRAEKGEDGVTPMVDIVNNIFLFRDPNRFSEWVDNGKKGHLDDNGNWQPSDLELRYLAWEYYYEGTYVNTDESYTTLRYEAHPPEKSLYI
jgi:hypothetical protein